jgi:hypothetical protein
MKLSTKIFLLPIGCVLAYGIGMEIVDTPRKVKAPPGVTATSFGDLSDFELPNNLEQRHPGDIAKLLPKSILDLDSKKVLIQGFMIPTHAENQKVKEFMLVRSQTSCCYGIPPQLYDVVEVHMTDKPAEPLMDRVVTVMGNFHVKEHWAGQYLGSLYQLDAESVVSASPYVLGSPLPPSNGSIPSKNLE